MNNDWKTQLAELCKDEEFQQKQTELAEKYKDDEAALKSEIIKLMAEYGVTEPEEGFVTPASELSDEELSAVAGGQSMELAECLCVFGGGGGVAGKTVCACVAGGAGQSTCDNNKSCLCVFSGYGKVSAIRVEEY